MSPKNKKKNAGLGLIDSLIAVALLGVVMTSLGTAIAGGQRLFTSGMSRSQVEIQMVRTLGRIREALYSSRRATVAGVVSAPFHQSELAFEQPDRFDYASNSMITHQVRLALELEDGELDDGLDNDQDGLIDEHRVVLTHGLGSPDEAAMELCRGVSELLEGELPNGVDDNGNGLIDEPGLCFDRAGDELNVRLSLEGRDRDGNHWIRTLESTVLLRN